MVAKGEVEREKDGLGVWDEQMRTITYRMEYYSAIKKNEIMSVAATWLKLEIIILSEVSQKEKDKYHMISLICGI